MEGVLTALAESDIAVTLRLSRWLYPIVNAAHIVGIALLVGTIIALDARILGYARRIPLAEAVQLLLPFTIGGFVLTVVAGFGLFIVQPFEYVANPAFPVKMGLIVLALANIAALRFQPGWRLALAGDGEIGASVKVGAALSGVLWLAVLFAGRLIAFFG
jgi:hypothetical protein